VFASLLHVLINLLKKNKEKIENYPENTTGACERPSVIYSYLKIVLEILVKIIQTSKDLQIMGDRTAISRLVVVVFICGVYFIFFC
jgi:hypothetical protein